MIWANTFKANWPIPQYEQYLRYCYFTPEELKIIELKRNTKTDVAISYELGYGGSTRTIERRISDIRKKISHADSVLLN